eukprot:scaffold270090_cov36-Tisochrysis_lutea.AAC.1
MALSLLTQGMALQAGGLRGWPVALGAWRGLAPQPPSLRTPLRLLCRAPPPMPPYLIEMQEELEAGEAQLFDVREPGEYAAGSLSQAALVPLSELQEGIAPPFDRTKLTYIHCAAGVRVRYAKPMLE